MADFKIRDNMLDGSLDENLAQLKAYVEAKNRDPTSEIQTLAEGSSGHATPVSTEKKPFAFSYVHGASAKDIFRDQSSESHVPGAQEPKYPIFRTMPNLFPSATSKPTTGFDEVFVRVGSDPKRHDPHGVVDENLAQILEYSPAKGGGSGRTQREVAKTTESAEAPVAPLMRVMTTTSSTTETDLANSLSSPPLTSTTSTSDASTSSTSDKEAVQSKSQEPEFKGPKPKYAKHCCAGWTTEEARKFWFMKQGRTEEEATKAATTGMSLLASSDPNEPIYYWQLYSVMGPERIEMLCRTFYEYIWNDDNPILRVVFQRLPGRSGLDHHVRAQKSYWIDAFGGGKTYPGGFQRVEFHHRYGASEIMNAEGAARWAYHMNKALQVCDLTDDPRVKVCLCDFLKLHMDKYGEKFKFDTASIKFGDTGLLGSVRSLNRKVFSMTKSIFKGKDEEEHREAGGRKPAAKSRWALVRGALGGGKAGGR
eukprot:CAMPEP_0181291340 /NCGR_PEP_ID=MMETSP1101-20121128/1913_1 /TAXON_ID=46948 /ORGANISM="Rhodomonas abbreviata, Strain Caron Lab Isolate" /LENGTH=479 /DNA_ID=CAMNT_0023395721 /DNA_START=150 /DNA_END=1589 /DNA_ORIENTATION=+